MEKLVIHTFGEFYISCGDILLNEQQKRSKKMWSLLQYLITFHNREISQNELIELLWPQGESSNPAGALKTQLYRLRTMLSESGLDGDELIINSSGSYAFNNSIEYEIDYDSFEALVQKSKTSFSDKEKLSCCLDAIDLYKGDFLTKNATEPWVVPINTYYRSIYIKTVITALEILYSFKRYNDVIDISRRSILIEQLNETIHSYLMKALCAVGDKKSAKAHYLYVLDLFYNREGINPSQSFVALYGEMMKSENEFGNGIEEIKAEMSEKSGSGGAFKCEYEAFKHIYQLELRDSVRTGMPVALCVLTVTDKSKLPLSVKKQNSVMQRLSVIIAAALRSSDVYARYSASQYIMIFPKATEELCELISTRIVKQFRHEYAKTDALTVFSYELVTKEED